MLEQSSCEHYLAGSKPLRDQKSISTTTSVHELVKQRSSLSSPTTNEPVIEPSRSSNNQRELINASAKLMDQRAMQADTPDNSNPHRFPTSYRVQSSEQHPSDNGFPADPSRETDRTEPRDPARQAGAARRDPRGGGK